MTLFLPTNFMLKCGKNRAKPQKFPKINTFPRVRQSSVQNAQAEHFLL